jgi:hypothetical protein
MKKILLVTVIIALVFTFTACDDVTDLSTNSGIDPGTDPGTDPNHSHQWGAWTATELAGTEERVCKNNATHIEARLTGTGRFTFQAISGVAAYSVSKGTSNIGTVRVPSYYRPSEENEWQPVTAVGDFSDCTSLIGIYIPEGVTSIGNSAFSGCIGLASVTIPASVTEIGWNAFSSCTSLASITIPASVTSIGGEAFSGCTNLASITIPASVTSIGNGAFSGTAWLNSQPDGLVYAGKVLYTYKGTMPADTEINNIRADTVAIVGGAFSNCTSLASITIPNSVTEIGYNVFSGCNNLATVTFAEDSQLQTIGNYAFSNCTSLTSITIPNSVTSIGYEAFYNCSRLTTVTFAEGFSMSIGNWFAGLTSLTTVNIPNSVTSIGNYAFFNCTSLASITIPAGVTEIGSYAFSSCTSLTSITIPASVTEIGYSAFYSWTSSQTIYVKGHASQAEADAAWGEEGAVYIWRSNCNATIVYQGGQ